MTEVCTVMSHLSGIMVLVFLITEKLSPILLNFHWHNEVILLVEKMRSNSTKQNQDRSTKGQTTEQYVRVCVLVGGKGRGYSLLPQWYCMCFSRVVISWARPPFHASIATGHDNMRDLHKRNEDSAAPQMLPTLNTSQHVQCKKTHAHASPPQAH